MRLRVDIMEEKHEECGVFGVYSQENRNVAQTVYYGLYALQHRGQESSGIAVAYADKISYHKGMGLVADVFSDGKLEALPEGDIAIGHVRYSTTGASMLLNAQPVVFTGKCGKMAVAHNGNLINTKALRDVRAGEIVVIDSNGIHSHMMENIPAQSRMCIFEYVYFARHDSVLDGYSVYEARKEAGRLLAKHYAVEADMVSGVPDSGNVAARGYAEESGIPFVEALAKNRYVGRTFIQPDQRQRESSLNVKMNALRGNVRGKRVVLIDDSIVRGTTMRKIIKMLRDAGAKEVHIRICSPIIKHPCHLGIDIQTYSQLIGAYKDEEQICESLGADSVRYLTVEQLLSTCTGANTGFCLGCFNGQYPYSLEAYEADKHKLD